MTYYLDVTELIGLRYTSGIQRVVREMTRHALAAAGHGRDVAAVIAVRGRFHRLTPAGVDVACGRAPAAPVAATTAPGGDNPVKALLRRVPALFSVAQRVKFARRIAAMGSLHDAEAVAFAAGDVVVLLDSLWSGGGALAAAADARRRGARIALVAYDIIPVTHPKLVSRALAYDFPRALLRALALADVVLPISRAAEAEVLGFAGSGFDPARSRPFYLGHDFGPTAEADTSAAALPVAPDPEARIYLMVGTIEPRKGHLVALDAFERLWAAGGTQTLVVIGKVGWRAEGFIDRARAHPMLGRRLFLIHDASDATLAAAIARADALIMASSLEGFGLPLVEALSADRPVIASDIAVFREIAGEAALFFRCGDPDALAAAVAAFERDPARWQAAARGFRWPNWGAATATFLDTLDALLAGQPARRSR